MPWLTAVLLAVGLVLLVVAGGVAVLVASGVRLRGAAGAAPAVGTGAIALSAVAASAIGAPWGVPAVVVGTAVCALLAAGVGWLGRRRAADATPADEPTPTPAADRTARTVDLLTTAAAVTVGSLLALVPLAAAMGRPDRVHNAWDALFHLAAVDLLRAGPTIDLRDVSELASPGNGITYPFAWHVLASLAPGGVDPVTATNVAGLVPAVVLGVAGTVALARALFPGTSHVAPVAAVLCGAALGAPLAVAIQPGLIPNAYGLALVPGALAWVVRPGRVTVAALVPAGLVVAGIGLTHPGALLGLLLLALPWVVARCIGWVRVPGPRSDARQRRSLVVALGVLGATVVGTLVLGGSPTATAVARTRVKEPLAAGETVRRLLTGDLGEWAAQPWVLVALVAVGTVALAVRRRQVPLLASAALAVATYAGAASSWPLVSGLTALWYTETRRIAPLVGLTATVIAAYGLVTVVTWARDVARRRGLRAAGPVAVVGAVVLLTGTVTTGVQAVHGNALDAFSQDVVDDPGPMSRMPYLTAAEEEMVERLRGVLGPDDLVLGSSFSGVGHLAVLAGTRTAQPYHTTAVSPDAGLVSAHLQDLGVDPTVCAAVRRIGATHVYVDRHPLHSTYWTVPYRATFTVPPGPAARPVDQGGSASVHSLDVCYPPA